jgi:N-acetyl-beta-hexosaminidase
MHISSECPNMTSTQTDNFVDHLKSKYVYPSKAYPLMPYADESGLRQMAVRAGLKSGTRVRTILDQIERYKKIGKHLTDGTPKKWQVKSYIEGKNIQKRHPDMIIFEDATMPTNTLDKIYASDRTSCCYGCGYPMRYANKKTSRIYIGFPRLVTYATD